MPEEWKSDRPTWSSRVQRNVIQRLYERDAQGIPDEALIDEVGIAFLARIESIDRVGDALSGRAHCPHCDRTIEHQMDNTEWLRCVACQWQLTWDDYHRSFRGKFLAALGIKPFLHEFSEAFPRAHNAREKMILIDTLIHRFHWELGEGPKGTAAKNLIGGKNDDLHDFLDRLAYEDQSTTELRENRERWLEVKRLRDEDNRKTHQQRQKASQEKAKLEELKRRVRQQQLSGKKRPSSLRQEYDEKGYVIARQAIDPGLAAETADHVQWLIRKHPDTRPERLHHGLLTHDPFMWRLTGDDRLLDIAQQFIGPNIALFAPHYIAKPPGDGKAVQWHQDGSYWPLEPMEVTTLWVAGTASTIENGCMRVISGTQNKKLLKRKDMIKLDTDKFVLGAGIRPQNIDDSDAVDLELEAGDISIHNPQIIHGSNPNTSDTWRVGLTLRYIPTTTWVTNPEHENILLRGEPSSLVDNTYADRPTHVPGEHMPFAGCGQWNNVP